MTNKLNNIYEKLGFTLLASCFIAVILIIVAIFFNLIVNGHSVINLNFLISSPSDGMTKGGILPAIIGTFMTTAITAVFSIPLGMGCAVYLNEYAKQNLFTRLIRISIRNLAGVPSKR